MAFPHPRKSIFTGEIELGPQPRTWISKHKSFASSEWLVSRVRYDEWIPDKSAKKQFLIYPKELDGIKPLTILIKLRICDTYAFVYHVHVLRKK